MSKLIIFVIINFEYINISFLQKYLGEDLNSILPKMTTIK